MLPDIARELRVLKSMTTPELKQRYAEVFGEETRSNHKAYLWKRIAWRIQALAEGDISEAARLHARELACDADLRTRAPKEFWEEPKPAPQPNLTVTGRIDLKPDQRLPILTTELTRVYKGRTIVVSVAEKGFYYDNQYYRSLSAIAKKVTGTNWNGYDFFGLKKKGGAR